jgi:hypothetical protein
MLRHICYCDPLIFLDIKFLRKKTKEMFYFVYLKATYTMYIQFIAIYADYKLMLVEVEGVVSSLSVVIASILFTSYHP